MRTDVGSIPLMCILSTLTSGVFGYLPTEDLTNSIIPGNGGFPIPPDTLIPTDGDEDSSPDEETDDTDIYRKKTSTFRRRNINAPFGGRVPFSRMAYKAGYGSNRIGFSRNTVPQPPQMGGFYGNGGPERPSNPYGTVNLGGGGSPYSGIPDEYNMRPSAPYSGLIGGSRAGYYGSTVGMRRGGVTPPMSSRKPKMPQTEYPPDYASNDLMNSFNGATNSAIPSLRELATYASRYGPAYLRERFGAHESPMERLPYGGGPQVPQRGGGMPIDFNMNIASNHWNKGPMGIMSRDVDSYQHDDAAKTNKKTVVSSTTGSPNTSTRKPRKARKPVKKTTKASSSSSTTTTVKPVKTSTKKSV
ncbi:hypothetical protein CRE_18479 [Caenorhabditis remanei]|uniref:Uncharacterized protein n=2 Tax=Caenorhabditis remanei TaxID=31234 RepID=E3LKQ8_CAERE|nr:hypothetical protein CRE_18479 [Caenorhabditis remanei]